MAEDLWLHLESGERTWAPGAHVAFHTGWWPCSLGLDSGSGAAQPCGLGPGLGRGESSLLTPTWRPLESQQKQWCAGAWTPSAQHPSAHHTAASISSQLVGVSSGSQCPPNLCSHREARPRGSGPPVLAHVWMKPQQLSPVRRAWMGVLGESMRVPEQGWLYIRCFLFIPSQPYTREGV